MLDLRSEGPFLTQEAVICAWQAEEIRTGQRPTECLLTLEQMSEFYRHLQGVVRFQDVPMDGANIKWCGMTLRCEEPSVCP